MRRAAMAALLIICLLGVIALSGCLFGKKGDGGGSTEVAKTEGPAPAGPGAAAGPGAKAGPAQAGGPPGGLGAPTALGGPALAGGKPGGAPAAGGGAGAVKAAKAAKAAGNYDKALQLLAGASPTDPEAQWLVAWMLAEKGQTELATAAFKAFIASAKATDPRVAKAKAALERLGAGAAPAAGPGGPPGMKGPGAPPAPPKGAGK